MTTQMGPFSSTFAPIVDESEIGKIMLDLLGLGFALTVAPLWNVGEFICVDLLSFSVLPSLYPNHQ
jgi:hypothetical protein